MGFYLRTSLRAGPFRMNLSTSGIGVSVGVPGFRVGSSPRSNYVYIGGQRVYLTNGGPPQQHRQFPATPPSSVPDVVMTELAGASVQQLVSAHPTEIVNQLQAASHRVRLWPFVAAAVLLLAALTGAAGLVILLLGVPLVLWFWQRDRARRSVVVFYRVEDEPARRYDGLNGAQALTCQAQRVWHVEAHGDLITPYQRKVNAGATGLNRRSVATADASGPPVMVTNIAIPSLTSKDRSVYFLPDRVIAREGKEYAEIPYAWLRVAAQEQRFIESEAVPGDSQQIDTTWQFANAKGGPDRRFKNNRPLPVMLYGRLTLSTTHGFLMVWDFSRPDVAFALADAVRRMAASP
jgi:hypothetical protein